MFLNLLALRFPIGAVVSIGHRLSGLLLVVALPFLVAFFERCLESERIYQQTMAAMRSPLGTVIMLILCGSLVLHVLAGVRHLLMDIDIGSSLPIARRTAWLVLSASAVAAATLAGGWWLS
nr:succinate dehydrogenase, cytochrome b556 subunit [Denitratisoma sp. DHT3]